ncbi:MAG: RDD family protein [Bacteroidetes bacterium]|nr:RDD family protein [Bacteroidota bacterium]
MPNVLFHLPSPVHTSAYLSATIFSRTVEQVRIDTAQNVTVALDVAPLGVRLVAAMLDLIVQTMLTLMLVIPGLKAGITWSWALVPALAALYPFASETLFDGRTLGKHLLRLRVARLDGQPPTIGQYAIRALLFPIDQACSGIGALFIAMTPKHQRLGDLAAGTTVVRDGDRVTLEETLYRAAEREASVTFPTAVYLTDHELEAVRRMATVLRQNPGEPHLYALATDVQRRVEARMETASTLPPGTFLETVLQDYNVLTGRL